MSRIHHLQLVLPQLLSQLRSAQQIDQSSVLIEWLRRGVRHRLWQADDLQQARLDPWQHSLLHALAPGLRAHGLASAALQWRGEGGVWANGTWLHAKWVHLAAGMEDLRLHVPPAPTPEEEAQLLASVRPSLALAGFDLYKSPSAQSGLLYLHSTGQLDLQCYSPHAGIANRIYEAMPQGLDAAMLRRVMTEVQMLLFEHPVNLERACHGLLSINALWPWGAAPLQLVSESSTQRVMSNEPYVQGLAEHLHLSCWPLPLNAEALFTVPTEQLLLVLPSDDLAALDAQWLAPIDAALRRGQIGQLDVMLDHWRVNLRGGRWAQLRRTVSGVQELQTLLA